MMQSQTRPLRHAALLIVGIFVTRNPMLAEAQTTDGKAANGVTYHVRVPETHDGEESRPAIVILHGSNMNSKAYVETIASRWPDLANDYILIGINGENRNPKSPPDKPQFNYTYTSFVGKSKYKGFPGTDRQSPALVAEVIEELKSAYPIGKLFVGGHSQGGYLTYSLMMNFPELVDGAFPISAGLIFQCEPTAYEKSRVRAAQRRVPLAIIHGENDPVVTFGAGRHALEAFEDEEFPAVRLFTHKTAGHMFAYLPIDRAIRWLESMSAAEPEKLVSFAEQQIAAGEYRTASAALRRARRLRPDPATKGTMSSLMKKIDEKAKPEGRRLRDQIRENSDSTWVEGFLAFRSRFQFAPSAASAIRAYKRLRKKQDEPSEKLFMAARKDFGSRDREAGYKKYEQIVKEFYASRFYLMAKRALDERK